MGAFRLARTVVRREQYAAFLEDTGRPAPELWNEPAFCHPQQPVVATTWKDAVAYCDWLAVCLGQPVRLPTEAEWERAAKADREVQFPWGDDSPESLPDYSERWLEGPEPVDAYPSRHPWNLQGLCENVHEWCADFYGADYYSESPREDPQGPATGRRRASRGGAWRHAIKVCSCGHRSSIPPDRSYSDYGFRVASGLVSRI